MRPIFTARGRNPIADRFTKLIRPHLERLHRLAFRYCGQNADAEDLVQGLLAKLMPKMDVLEQVEDLGPWLARALHNHFIDQVRHRAVSPVDLSGREDQTETLESLVDLSASPEDFVERQLTSDRITTALLQLAPEQRALVVWHDVEGYTLEELSESQGVSLGTLKSRLHRARARLRQILMQPFRPSVRV